MIKMELKKGKFSGLSTPALFSHMMIPPTPTLALTIGVLKFLPRWGTTTTFVLGILEGAITTCVRGSGALNKGAEGATTATGRAAEQDSIRINIDR